MGALEGGTPVNLKGHWLVVTVLAPLLVLGVLAAAGGGGGSADDEAATRGTAEAEVQEVVVVGTEFAFEPSEITVKQGQPVTLVLENDGTVEHDLQVNGLHAQMMEAMHAEDDGHAIGEMVHVYTMPGATGHVEFIPEDAGTFEIVCTIPGHADAGMVGTLIVE